ncbi:flagellin FliC [bacterium]|nr:flagellin FliC [bacterium]
MALVVNTNLSSKLVRNNLNKATTSLNNAIERMTTGYRINHASDNAANFSIATNWRTQLGSIDVALSNANMGVDMLSTLEENYGLITTHLQRIRDLTEQASNGTYGSDSLTAIKSEIIARLDEIDRISANTEFNGIELMSDDTDSIMLQVGINDGSNNRITLGSDFIGSALASALLGKANATFATDATTKTTASAQLTVLDNALKTVTGRVTNIGAAQNRLASAIDSLNVQSTTLTSSLSTVRDADVGLESSEYIRAQILQQASATLLSTANQAPSIALNLL